MTKEKVSFEKSVARLDEIVSLLEKGDVPLGDALGLFEEGTALVRQCSALLDAAEQKVTLLSRGSDGEPSLTPFPGTLDS